MQPVLDAEQLTALLDEAFPQMQSGEERPTVIELIEPGRAKCRLRYNPYQLRPGGTISGPAMMGLADHAMYVVLLAHIGWVPLAVTTNLSINFLRKPEPKDLIAEAMLLKLGKSLAVGEISIRSDGSENPVAHVVSTYSIPPR